MKATKQKNTPLANSIATVAAIAVLTMAEATAMKQADRIAVFKAKDQQGSRLTVELAKLLTAIRADMKDPSPATAILKKQGIRPGSVNMASENARVFTALVPDHLDEAAFDRLTTPEMRSINRCMSGASKRKLDAEEVANLIKAAPDTFDEKLESIFATGMTVAECDAQAEQALKDAEQKKKDDAAKAAATPAPAPVTPAAVVTPPAASEPETEAVPAVPETAPAPAVETPPAPPAPAPTPAPVAQTEPPTNVQPMPPAVNKATLQECMDTCDLLEMGVAELSDEDAEAVFHRLAEINTALAERLGAPTLAKAA